VNCRADARFRRPPLSSAIATLLTLGGLTLTVGCTEGTAPSPTVVHGHGIRAEYGVFHGVVATTSQAVTPRVSIYIRAVAQVGRGGPRLSVEAGRPFSVKLLYGYYIVHIGVDGKHCRQAISLLHHQSPLVTLHCPRTKPSG
jgi:hypothetical protein